MSKEPITNDRDDATPRRAQDARSDQSASPPTLHGLVHRLELAAYYQRAARARQLRTQHVEALALEHIAAAPGLPAGEIADRLGLTSGGMTALTERLESAGLVARRRHPSDRRVRVLFATPEGLEQARRYVKPLIAPAEQAGSWLSEADREVVVRFLELLISLKEQSAAQTPPPERDGPQEPPFEPTLLM